MEENKKQNPQQNKPAPKPITIRRPKTNLKRSRQLISQLEARLNSKVICYYTAGESSISQNHPDFFFELAKEIGQQEKISLVVISYGGSSQASLRIATILREFCNQLQVLVPSRCASAATVLSLAADKIIMSPAGYLTAIDSSVRHELNPKGPDNRPIYVSVDQVNRVLDFLTKEGPMTSKDGVAEGSYRTLFRFLHPLALAEINRYSSGSELIATKMMKMHAQSFENEEEIKRIANHLVTGYPAHSFPILYPEAKEIGLPVEKADQELSDLLRELDKVYYIASEKTTTNLNPDFLHVEGSPIIIESLEKRFCYYYNYNRRFHKVSKRWQTERDLSQWLKMIISPHDPEKVLTAAIDVPNLAPPPETATPEPAPRPKESKPIGAQLPKQNPFKPPKPE